MIYLRSLAEHVLDAIYHVIRGPITVPDHAHLCPDFVEPAEERREWQQIVTARIDLATDLRYGTGLADHDIDEWDREVTA